MLVASALALLGAPAAVQAQGDLPQVAVDPNGNANFTWQRLNVQSYWYVQARQRSVDGTYGAIRGLSSVKHEQPQVGVAADGVPTFVWQPSPAGETSLQANRIYSNGSLGTIMNITGYGQPAADSGQVAVTPGGTAVIAWRRNNIIQTRSWGTGTGWPPDMTAIQNVSATGAAVVRTPQVAVAPNGTATFVWDRGGIIQARTRSAAGTFTPIQNLTASGRFASFPQVAVDPDGNSTFVWQRYDEDGKLVIQTRARSAAGTLSAIQQLSAAGQNARHPQVAVDPDGVANFVWQRFNGANQIVQARTRGTDGTLSAEQNLSAAGRDAVLPQLAVDPNGIATFTWRRSNGTSQIIQARTRAAAGPLSTTYNLSAADVDAHNPQVAVAPDGTATFVWRRDPKIQTRRLGPTGTLGAIENLY
jgi:hypothetical protein